MTGFIKIRDILRVINLPAIVKKDHISKEIILEKPEQILPRAEEISLNMNKGKNQMKDTSPMDRSVFMKMPLHTEMIPEEKFLHTREIAKGTNTTIPIDLTDIGENPVALTIDTAIVTTKMDRALLLTEENRQNIRKETPDNLQQEMDNLNSVEDHHQEIVEKTNAEDVELQDTQQTNAKCSPIGGANLVTVGYSTEEETAIVLMEHLSQRWSLKKEEEKTRKLIDICT